MLIAFTGAAAALRRAGHRVRALVHSAGQRVQVEPTADEWQDGDQYDPEAQAELVKGVAALTQVAIGWEALNQGPIANFEVRGRDRVVQNVAALVAERQ